MLKPIAYALTLFFFITACHRKDNEDIKRTKVNINKNWMYSENPSDQISIAQSSKDWVNINLPHTWNSEDVVDAAPGYRRSGSWYRKTIAIKHLSENLKYSLYFEGVNISSKVYVNGIESGGHIGGYIGFDVDITPHLKKGDNDIMVYVNNFNNRDIIPSQKSDFFIYGGITRDVWLITKSKTAIADVKIITPKVSEKSASLKVTTSVDNANNNLKLRITLKDPQNKEVTSKTTTIKGARNHVALFKNINNPTLWDTENPNLYSVTISLIKDGKSIDEITERFGFRWFEFKKHGPFYLNGKRLLLRGTHRHEEHAGVGAAMSNKQHRKDMEQIKEMGANFVRLAHYPQDPEIYKACDELGLLVWDELPWCRGGLGETVWKKHTKRMLEEIIHQNYNHPSIIIWSLGNEIYWLPDFENGDDTDNMNAFLKELNTLAHELDPTRKTAIRKYYAGADIVDVFSPSIWSGWYSGNYKNYQKAVDLYKKKYKHFLHAEYGGASHLGRHTENPITGEGVIKPDGWEESIIQTHVKNIAHIGDWSENYIVDLFDWHLKISEIDSTFVGNIQWAFKDFGTPLRPDNDIPYINQKGVVDRKGTPKDAFYVFKSYWAKKPFVYIESHTWTDRQGPKGLAREISVYSNCKKVTLFHNGKKLHEKNKDIHKFPASGLTWDIQFKEGNNELVAVGISEGNTVKDTINVNYRYTKNKSPRLLKLQSKKLETENYLITVTALDKSNLRCLDYEEKIYFQCLRGGKLLKNQGTPTGSDIINMANGEISIEVIPDNISDSLEIMVLNQNFKGTFLKIEK